MPTADTPPVDRFPFTPRWAALLPTLGVLLLGFLFARFFLDGLVRRAVEKAGTAANGAKVELAGVDISILHTSITLHGLQAADPADPMTNRVEINLLRFKLSPKPLFWKKVVIQDASITGIRTGTPRKTSGALPKASAAPAAAAVKSAEGPGLPDKAKEAASFAWGNLKKQYDPKTIFQTENLSSLKKIKEEQVHYQAIADTWGTRVDALKTDDVDGRVKTFVDRVKKENYSGLEGVKKAAQDLKEAKKLKSDAEALAKGFQSLKADVTGEIDRAKGTLSGIDDLKRADLDNALGGLKTGASPEGIARGIIGGQWSAKIKTYLDLIEKIRSKIPKKKAEAAKPEPPKERKGKDIAFPFHYNWPTFLLAKAALAGATPGGLGYEGTIKDATSDPIKLGRPMTMNLAGKQGPQAMTLTVVLDYTKEDPREKMTATYAGMPLAGVKLGDAGGPVTIKDGRGSLKADVSLKGPALAGEIAFNAAPVALNLALPADKTGDRLLALLHDTLARMNALEATVGLSGTIISPKFALATTLDDQIKAAVKQALQKEIDDVKASAQKRLDELVDGEKKKLLDQIDGKAAGAMAKLGLKDKQVGKVQEALNGALNNLTGKSKGSILPTGNGGQPKIPGDLKKLFKLK